MPDTATTGAPRLRAVWSPDSTPGDGQDRSDGHERVRRRDDDRRGGLERRVDLRRRARILHADEAQVADRRAPGDAGRSSPGTRASPQSVRTSVRTGSVGHRQDPRADAEGSLEVARDVGRAVAPAQPRRPHDVRRQVAIPEPEPRLLAVPLEHLARGERLAWRCPSPTRGCRCPASVYMTVSWSGEIDEAVALGVVGRVDDRRRGARRSAPADRAASFAPPTPPASRTTGALAEPPNAAAAAAPGRCLIVGCSQGGALASPALSGPRQRVPNDRSILPGISLARGPMRPAASFGRGDQEHRVREPEEARADGAGGCDPGLPLGGHVRFGALAQQEDRRPRPSPLVRPG